MMIQKHYIARGRNTYIYKKMSRKIKIVAKKFAVVKYITTYNQKQIFLLVLQRSCKSFNGVFSRGMRIKTRDNKF